jgi:hypothetical protein
MRGTLSKTGDPMSDDPFSPSVHEASAFAVTAGAGNLAAAAAERTSVPDTLSALLGHELAVGHRLMMRLAAEVDGMIDGISAGKGEGRVALEAARLAGVVARLMERYWVGVMALHKLRGKSGLGETVIRLGWATADDDKQGGSGSGASGASSGGQAAGGGSGAACASASEAPASAIPARPGRLRNGNPSGDYTAAPRCGARTRAGPACRQPSMANGRCRLHGGLSRGPVTPEGRERSRCVRLKHGGRAAGVIAMRAEAAASGRRLAALLDAAGRATPAGHGVDRSDSDPPRSPAGSGRSGAHRSRPLLDAGDAPAPAVDPVGRDAGPAEPAGTVDLHQPEPLLEPPHVARDPIRPVRDFAALIGGRMFVGASHVDERSRHPGQPSRQDRAPLRLREDAPSGGAPHRMIALSGRDLRGHRHVLCPEDWITGQDLLPARLRADRPSQPPAMP